MIDGLRRGKWLANRTVGMVQRVASTTNAMRPDEWEALREAVETYGNQVADEAVVAARAEVVKYLRERAARHEHGASGSVIADVLRECALAVEVTP